MTIFLPALRKAKTKRRTMLDRNLWSSPTAPTAGGTGRVIPSRDTTTGNRVMSGI